MIKLNEYFSLKPVRTFAAGTERILGWQLKPYNTTDRPLRIGGFYAMPGIVDEALQGDPVFPTPEAAVAAWEDSFTYPIGTLAGKVNGAVDATFDHATKKHKKK